MEDWAELRSRLRDAVANAHRRSIHHRQEVEASGICGCFSCGRRFGPGVTARWIRDEGTALRPHCGIDAVIGDASGYEVSAEFLARKHEAWFKIH